MSSAVGPLQSEPLGELELAILRFERETAGARGGREAEIRERFDMSAPRYHQVLNQLIDTPAALQADPLLVRRLRRLREGRRRARSAATLRD